MFSKESHVGNPKIDTKTIIHYLVGLLFQFSQILYAFILMVDELFYPPPLEIGRQN